MDLSTKRDAPLAKEIASRHVDERETERHSTMNVVFSDAPTYLVRGYVFDDHCGIQARVSKSYSEMRTCPMH